MPPPPAWPGAAGRPLEPGRRASGARIVFALALVVGLLLGAVAGGLATNAFVTDTTEDAAFLPDLPRSTAPATPDVPGTEEGSGTSPDGLADWDQVAEAVSVGVVNIQSRMAGGVGSGTGMVLTDDGRVLTNNHVVEGGSSIVATIATTGESYRATIVGTDVAEDVAVLQLVGASGLPTVPLGDSDGVEVGDAIAAIGNAGGGGGEPTVATGQVTALGQRITASDEDGTDVQTLDDMIQVAADVVPGDSGGPLADDAGEVVGMNTAANAAGFTGPMRSRSGVGEGYAIPINKALDIAEALVANGTASGAGQGSDAYLGVQVLAAAGGGAEVADVLTGSPAAAAGIQVGDTIVDVDGTEIATPDDLVATISAGEPGDRVAVTWTDASGRTNQATVTLGSG